MNNLITAISQSGGILVHAVDSTALVADMERVHMTSATASAALGRLLTAAALIGSMQKNSKGSITLKIKGGGPIGTVIAVCDAKGNTRGYCDNPRADSPLNSENGKLNVGGIVGRNGVLIIVKDNGISEPYTGQVPLVSGEIAEDITSYYALSEQTPTVCALGVLVNPGLTIKAAGGYILQLMPGASDGEIELIENNIAKMDSVTALVDAGNTPEQIAFSVLNGFAPQILDMTSAQYKCNCSRKKMEGIMRGLGKKELFELADEAAETEIVCSYCNKKYLFSSGHLYGLVE